MIYDLIVIGSGASGIISAIVAGQNGKKVLLLEKLNTIASKLKATGGGKCNITNTLSNEEFMKHFGRNGRFMRDALSIFDSKKLIKFLNDIEVSTHAPDGFRVFPTSHSSKTIIDALQKKMKDVKIEIVCEQNVQELLQNDKIFSIITQTSIYKCKNIIIATGGMGYPSLGTQGDGYKLVSKFGHKTTPLFPAMLPLYTKERWVERCTADTIAKVKIKIDIKKHKTLQAMGDLIFTKKGIRGPVVLDFAREITPLIAKYHEVPILLNLTNGMNEDKIIKHLKKQTTNILEATMTILPKSVATQLCKMADIDTSKMFSNIKGIKRDKLISLLAWTPLTVIDSGGFDMAMITRGGISLKEIDPKTMQSRLVKGLYFCGEVVDLDGKCGGYNLQWAFSSGYLAGFLHKN